MRMVIIAKWDRIIHKTKLILQTENEVTFVNWKWKASFVSDVLFSAIQSLFHMQALNIPYKVEPADVRTKKWWQLIWDEKNGFSLRFYDQAVFSERMGSETTPLFTTTLSDCNNNC